MAKPWVEGGYYEECSGKWGWKNKEIKNKSKVTQELVEKKSKEKKRKKYKKYKQEKKRVTYTNEERRENTKVKECEKLGKIKR